MCLPTVLSGIGALGGLCLAVGAAVVGGLLTSGGDMLHDAIEGEFPLRASRCAKPIDVYAWYVGVSLLALAASCAIGALVAVCAIDGACKLANACTGPADESEELSLVSGTTPRSGPPLSAMRPRRTTPLRTSRTSADAEAVELTPALPVVGCRLSEGLAMSAPTAPVATPAEPPAPTPPAPTLATPSVAAVPIHV